ncbi:MAG: carboxypeptidase regulatory-like domain-containing protein, partial [Acidobacteria bacterium]|nr:carboxypeptidase regulatory-like domain-containing protein [Acidobacteriota bacterium]
MHTCLVPQGRIVFLWLLVFSIGVLAVGDLQAQVEKATLSGTVFDPSGAVIVDAVIEAKNVKTELVYSAVTDEEGRYILPDMTPGTYDVSAEQAGFQTMVQTGIVASVGARRVLDFTLEVGQPVDVVSVFGQASVVETETASLSTLISPVQMEFLPLNGRNFTDLLSLSASVATVPATGGGGGQSPTAYGQSTNYSVSGSRPVGMAYMLDNTDIRNQMDHGAGVSVMGTSPGMEAIQEFTILTNTYSAEFGGSGAAVNAVTKSGTNDFHGTVYEYFRNSVMDARNYFDVPSQKKPSFKRNNFGVSLGGPIKKEKAFFFFNYEGLRASTGTTSRAVVPTSLPELFTAGGFTQDEYGQWAGEFGPINPVVQSIFEMYPLAQSDSQCPNVSGINFLPGTGLYCSQEKQIGNQDYVSGRVDIKLGDMDSLFVRYARESAYQVLPYVYTQLPGWPEVDHERNQYLTIDEQHTFSPRVINDFRFGYVRLFTETANGGINGTGTALQQVPGRQDMNFSPGWGLASLGPSPSSPSRPVMNRFSVGDTVFMSRGAHSLRFGATMTRMQLNMVWNQYSGGAWIFANLGGGIFSFLGPEGGQLGGALYGAPLLGLTAAGDDYTYTTPDGESYPFNPSRYWRQIYFSPFIQDDWKITRNLTLNLGLRYEWASNPTTVGEPVFTINNLTSPTTTQDDFVAVERPFKSNPNNGNFDPRIGVAWDVFGNHKTSIRAGFGTFHEPVTSRTYANNNTSYRPNQPLFFLFWTSGLFPNLPSDPHQIINSPLTGPTLANQQIAWYYALPNTVDKAPYMMQYNVAVQQELTSGTVLTVAYNGSRGKNLFLWSNQNPPLAFSDQSAQWQDDNAANWPGATGEGPRGTVANPFVGIYTNPNFKAVEGVTPTARSTYNGLQISLSRQFAGSLVGNVAYTFSRCRDNASATNSSEQGQWAVYNAYDPDFDWGPCSYNSDHVFTANALYRLPLEGNRAVDGWQLGTIVTRYTGLPFNLQNQFGGEYQSRTGGATEGERPNVVPGCNPQPESRDQWYNPECFVFAP